MTFNIGSQNGGVINNVGGDQLIAGGQSGTLVTIGAARGAVRQLRQLLDSTPLPPPVAPAAAAELDGVDTELHRDPPDRQVVADRLRRLAGLLASAGSLASTSVAMAGPLRTLIAWLGHFGEPIARMLPSCCEPTALRCLVGSSPATHQPPSPTTTWRRQQLLGVGRCRPERDLPQGPRRTKTAPTNLRTCRVEGGHACPDKLPMARRCSVRSVPLRPFGRGDPGRSPQPS